jgi:PAS domain S-box-containing protein
MRLSTAEKVNAGFAAALAVVAVIGVAAVTSIQLFISTSGDVHRTHRILAELHSTLTVLNAAESAQRGFVITGDESYLAPFTAAHRTLPARIAELRQETSDPVQLERLASLGAEVALKLRLMHDIVEARRTLGPDTAATLIATGAGRDVMASIRNLAAGIEARESQRVLDRQRTAERRARLATLIIAGGGIFTFLVVFGSALLLRRDFSERKRAEQALRDSETLLSQFMENLPIGVIVVDAQWQPRFANNAAVDILGPRILIDSGERPLPLLQADGTGYPETRTPVHLALNGEPASIDDAELEVDGRRIPLEVSAAPIYDASGRIAYAIAAFRDISERRGAEEALRAAKEAAEGASRTKSDFLARMSHELRTPLNSVIGFANILLKNRAGNLTEQDRAYLDRILENGKQLLLLINDILDLSKIEAGKIAIETERVDLRELVSATVRQWDGQLPEGLAMRSSVPDRIAPVTTDGARLRQILTNLIGNAVKFTERGEVHVSVELARNSTRPARIRVRDTGIGIPRERLDAIFEAFEQADSSTARRFGGTGLGLPISRALCELLGYRLDVRSEVGVGTEFTIELQPDRTSPPHTTGRSGLPATATAPAADRLVLIVDDEADSRILLTHYVEEFGCRTIATHSGRNALTLARELHPDLITLDLMMPDMNGWELLTRLKEDPKLCDIPVVIVSIVAHESRASLLGALDILQKPVDRTALFHVLRRNIGARRPRVLVVEDEADARALMAESLADRAAEVRTARNGREALELLHTFEPDLVITDLLMPEMDGMTFIELFRSSPRFQHVPVVVVTARDLQPAELDRLQRHTAAVLQKGNALDTDLRRVLGSILTGRDGNEAARGAPAATASGARPG